MRDLIEQLCGPECAGRRTGTPGGDAARAIVVQALRDAGLDPYEQPAPECGGANVLAKIRGDVDRYVLVGAHFDHLGTVGEDVYRGADDNASAVAVLVEVARARADERAGRGVIIAAFDGEEPPFFATGAMGSSAFVRDLRDRRRARRDLTRRRRGATARAEAAPRVRSRRQPTGAAPRGARLAACTDRSALE